MRLPFIPRLSLCLAFASVTSLPASLHAAAPDSRAPVNLWREVSGGPTTSCALGTPFSFFVHTGHPRRLLIYIGGGGACWNVETCAEHPSFDPAVDSTDHPRGRKGILDFSQRGNPFRSYTAILIPYCTGDVHLGTHAVTYTPVDSGGGAHPLEIRHTGHANVRSALDWAFETMPDPEVVFVAGSSGGAIASPYYAALLARHYPRARIVQLGDAAGGYRAPGVPRLMATWGATDLIRQDSTYAGVDFTAMTFEVLYTHAGRGHSRVRFSQVNSVEDREQLRFLALIGVRGVPLRPLLAENLAGLHRAIPSFRAFTAPGSTHTFIASPDFYTLRVDGVRLRDWVAALAQGRSVENVGEELLESK